MIRPAFLLISLLICFSSAKAQTPDEIPFPTNLRIAPDKYGIYSYCEHEPTFPGGLKALEKFPVKNLKWPDKTGMTDVHGKVFVSFVVEKNGSLTNFRIVRSLEPLFDAEAIRVLKKSPKWHPGTVKGHIVRAKFIMPVVFQPDE